MSDHQTFIEQAKSQLDKLNNDLNELDRKAQTAAQSASDWSTEQMTKLRNDWQEASAKVEKLASDANAEAKSSYDEAKTEAERHWKALHAAVQTYRAQTESTAAN